MMDKKCSPIMGDEQYRAMISEMWTVTCVISGGEFPQPYFSVASVARMRDATLSEIVDHLKFLWDVAEKTALNKKTVEAQTGAHIFDLSQQNHSARYQKSRPETKAAGIKF